MYMTYFFYVYCTYIVQKWYYTMYIYQRFLTYLVYIPVLSYHMTHYFSSHKILPEAQSDKAFPCTTQQLIRVDIGNDIGSLIFLRVSCVGTFSTLRMPLLSFDAYMQKVNATPANEAIPAIQTQVNIPQHNFESRVEQNQWFVGVVEFVAKTETLLNYLVFHSLLI